MLLPILLALSAQAINPPSVERVYLARAAAGCVGTVGYALPLRDTQTRAALGDAFRSLPLVVPCARLDAVDALLPLPNSLGGKVTVRTEEVRIARKDDGTCRADLVRTLTPTDADVLEARGVVLVEQEIPTVACTRITQALVGAQIRRGGGAGWPVRLVALPLPVEP